MKLYSHKQRWKWVLSASALALVVFTLWYSQSLIEKIRAEEKQKAELWGNAIVQRAAFAGQMDSLFSHLRIEEKAKAEMLGKALRMISTGSPNTDYTFLAEYLSSNKSIPILLFDKKNRFQQGNNLPVGKEKDLVWIDSLKSAIEQKYNPILIPELGMKLYYDDSKLYKETEQAITNLRQNFLDETVVRSTSVPVIVVDDQSGSVVFHGNIAEKMVNDPQTIERIKLANAPIHVMLPNNEQVSIYYEDSLILRQLRYFPIAQLSLIALFLVISYFIFSAYRKAEQNQVWVGMAKETAHQLGTPLSSLMGWGALLEEMNIPKEMITELNKDVNRLQIITERFSKIGSSAELHQVDLRNTVSEALSYVQKRISPSISVTLNAPTDSLPVYINEALFGWVIENLVRNAADAMDKEKGSIHLTLFQEEARIIVDVQDNGKGIPKSNWKTVFKPGYTTKMRGWGLGLTLVKRIVEEYHRGSIYVKHSENDKGTTFRIELKAGIHPGV